jgi:hypothetical protein
MMISPMTPRSKPLVKGTFPGLGGVVAFTAFIPGAMLAKPALAGLIELEVAAGLVLGAGNYRCRRKSI